MRFTIQPIILPHKVRIGHGNEKWNQVFSVLWHSSQKLRKLNIHNVKRTRYIIKAVGQGGVT